jgi:hypothetical protein
MVMNTDPNTDNMREVLWYIYSNIYVEYVVKVGTICTGRLCLRPTYLRLTSLEFSTVESTSEGGWANQE